jgi:hypothetical protein
MVAHYAACPEVIRVRFEDLVTSPDATMRRVARQLELPWEATLLAPTQLGGSHAPNSSFARQGATIHGGAADDWVDRIDPAARRYIETALASAMGALGYRTGAERGRTVTDSAPLLQ